MEAFKASRQGRVTARISADERDYLLYLLAELEPVLAPLPVAADQDPLAAMVGISSAVRPDEPGVLRLFPDAYADPDAAAEFRRFTEQGLREAKTASLQTMRETLVGSGEKVVLSRPQAEGWISTLNDLRLLMGTRLGVTAEFSFGAEADPQDPATLAAATYEFLGWVQGTLLFALDGA